MRIMWFGDLAGTGFGSVTMDFGRALLDLGHDVRFVSQNEIGELPEPFASRTFSVNDPDGWWALAQRGGVHGLLDGSLWEDAWVPERALILGDFVGVRLLVMATEESIAAFRSVPTFHYYPCEGVDLPPKWKELWDVITPIAMSEFGATAIEKVTGVRPQVIYHGVDTTQFRPVTPERPLRIGDRTMRSKADCKRFFGGHPKAKWLLRADRLMPRKMYPSLLRSLAPVLHARPDTFLITHCRSEDQGGSLADLISKYPGLERRILNTGFHDQVGGASRDILTALYNAADVYVSNSAEGFGLTVAEAVACGTPVVGMDYSAVPEVIGPAGVVVPVAHLVDSEYGFPWAMVDEPAYGQAVYDLLGDDVTRARMGKAGPGHVRETFRWSHAAELFVERQEVAA